MPSRQEAILDRAGEVWRILERRQRDYLRRMGVEAPFVLLTDALEKIDVRINNESMTLSDAMFGKRLFLSR